MNPDRRPYKRETEDVRRDALIAAALELVAEGGPKAATVRAIADRAGVTAGLIRHYFTSKDELVRESYHRMTADNVSVLDDAHSDPVARLAIFVAASLLPPVVDSARLGLWAGFMHGVQHDPDMRQVHIQTYLAYRDILQGLIADCAYPAEADCQRVAAIACNGVIDGLWMEASAAPEVFLDGEILNIGLRAVGAILKVDLVAAYETAVGTPA
jgi:TetR/AcrR family transcriptional regulator, transcriptional repressor of bet genes